MNRRIFIAGTDTDCGKTYVTCQLLNYLKQHGHSTMALKPVASGLTCVNGAWLNSDIERINQCATITLSKSHAYANSFKAAISPNIAAQLENRELSVKNVLANCAPVLSIEADFLIIEGCGGWWTPINATETMADIALAFDAEVILVVGVKLGGLNHSLLTYHAMKSMGAKIIGWVANCADPAMEALEANISTLTHRIQAPLLARLEHQGVWGEMNYAL